MWLKCDFCGRRVELDDMKAEDLARRKQLEDGKFTCGACFSSRIVPSREPPPDPYARD